MNMSPLGKYLDQLRFVFLTSFVFSMSFLLFHCYLTFNDHGIAFFLFNMNDVKHAMIPIIPSHSPLSFNETICCSNQNNVTKVEGNRREKVINSPPLIGENVEHVKLDPCLGQYIYVYDLPTKFNEDLLKGCDKLNKWVDMCPYMTNLGLGPKIIENSKEGLLSRKSWYATNQFSLEVIFHSRMKHHKCLTNDSSLASAIYVPYYAGLDIGKYLWGYNVSMRDASPKELVKWLAQRPQWKKMMGRDHFMVGGRIGWDFRRRTDEEDDWGTKLMHFPEARNMSMLLIESVGDNDCAIPYPTNFHPSNDKEILHWQEKVRTMKRPYLFSFAGAPRPNSSKSIRSELIKHCQSSPSCKLLGCFYDTQHNCNDPMNVMKLFQSSVFCLQPAGDSFTRRSTFDSILAGCIPVFFHPQSAYEQYLWHFPRNGSNYSVYIPESEVKEKRVLINETLSRVSKSEVVAMREEVIRLIPRIIYSDPSFKLETFEDAFDIAVKGILERVEAMRNNRGYKCHTFSA